MTNEEAIKWLIKPAITSTDIGEIKEKEIEAYNIAIEALTEPTVIRSKTLMPTKDFKEWAKRVRENNPSVIVIPCDAEVVPVETTATNTEKSSNCGDLISRADAIAAVHGACVYCDTCDLKDSGCSQINALSALPSAEAEWIPLKRKEADVVTIDESI